jgi:hypothetical protein
MRWVRDQLFMGLRATLTRMIKAGELTLLDLGTCGPEVARAIVQNCPDLANVGIQVLEIAKLNINLSDEDQRRIDEAQGEIVAAKLAARKARIAVSQAEAEAQARQFQLDQDFMNRARYVNQVDMARYQQYAGAEAALGLGQGFAQGGPGAEGGAAAAGVMQGLALGAGLGAAQRAPVGYGPPPGYYPPGPGYGPAPGYPPQAAPPYPPQGAPPPQAAAAPTGAQGAARCAACGAQNPAAARFCAECGQRIAP